MKAAVPDVWDHADVLFSHAYPASGVGYGFNAPYSQALPGLQYYELELAATRPRLQVVVSETGWATHRQGLPICTEQQKAAWTVSSYINVWGNDTRIAGVTPFMLQGPTWGDQDGYGYVSVSGSPYPVYGEVAQLAKTWGWN